MAGARESRRNTSLLPAVSDKIPETLPLSGAGRGQAEMAGKGPSAAVDQEGDRAVVFDGYLHHGTEAAGGDHDALIVYPVREAAVKRPGHVRVGRVCE